MFLIGREHSLRKSILKLCHNELQFAVKIIFMSVNVAPICFSGGLWRRRKKRETSTTSMSKGDWSHLYVRWQVSSNKSRGRVSEPSCWRCKICHCTDLMQNTSGWLCYQAGMIIMLLRCSLQCVYNISKCVGMWHGHVCVSEGDRASVFRSTKVRNKLKGDASWMQPRNEPQAETDEEKPW